MAKTAIDTAADRRGHVFRRSARVLHLVTAAIVLSATFVSIAAQDSPGHAKESLQFSCPTQPFIDVSASTPKHDALPTVDLTLTDPKSRIAGRGTGEKRIPDSRYGEVIEIPSAPERSLSLIVEACNAQQGEYHIKIVERGSDPYRLSVRGSAKEASEILVLQHISREGRHLQYVFRFRIDHGRAVVRWVNGEGSDVPPSSPIEFNDW
jgi:hypothetical protein